MSSKETTKETSSEQQPASTLAVPSGAGVGASEKSSKRAWSDEMELDENISVTSQVTALSERLARLTPRVDRFAEELGQSGSVANQPLFGTTKQRKRERKPKKERSKGKKSEPKIDRQSKSYVVTSSDVEMYLKRHRVSDAMFKHYLSKRISYECFKVKRRLSRVEIKKLFPPVRALCLEILATVKTKKIMNQEKKIVLSSVNKATGTQLRWADIVSGKRSVPPTQKDILLSAKDDKIRRQSTRIQELEVQIKKKDQENKSLSTSLANLTDRIRVLEEKERSRRVKDTFADQKRLAAKGQAFCHICLPPSSFVYRKPLVEGKSTTHGREKVECSNCRKREIHLSAGTYIPVYDCDKSGRSVFLYPEGHILCNKALSLGFRHNKLRDDLLVLTRSGSTMQENEFMARKQGLEGQIRDSDEERSPFRLLLDVTSNI